jgi:hypothetical protein
MHHEPSAGQRGLFRCALLAVVVWLLVACGSGQPIITLGADHYDFGEVKQGQVVTAAIPVRNTGQKALEIEAVSTSCGCTSALVAPTTIAPGAQGILQVRYDSGVHPDAGPVQRMIFIASNDPHTPEQTVFVTADVQVPVP